MKDVFEKYLLSLRQDRGDKTEHSDRGALETLLKAAAEDADPGIRVIHEAKKVREHGQSPDLFVPVYYRPFDVRYTPFTSQPENPWVR